MIKKQLDCYLQSSYFSASSLTHTSLLSMARVCLHYGITMGGAKKSPICCNSNYIFFLVPSLL